MRDSGHRGSPIVATAALLAALALGGCATSGGTGSRDNGAGRAPASPAAPVGAPPGSSGGASSSVPASAAPAAASGSRPDNASLKPFREVVAGATELKGLFPLWQKDDRVWIEIPVERLDQPFFFSYNVSDSVGERGAYAAQMGRRHVAVFHRVGNAMQLIARNARFAADPGSPAERAVRQSFSDSLIGSAPVLSQPRPDGKSVLIDASALFMTDIPGYSTTLEAAFRINYTLDRANSSFVKVHADDRSASFAVRDHFSTARLPGILQPNNPIPPTLPSTPPDARSVFIGFVYNFLALPEPMKPRYADDRVGLFTTTIANYATDAAPDARRYFVNRWRLEKKDPAAALSDPKEPIVFWVDRNVPVAYRDTIVEGILAWNAAFERIGISHAIVAKIEPDDADFDTLDARHASVRWYLGADAGFAIGPSHTDPRTGEILDADIAIPDIFTRNARTLVSEALPQPPKALDGALPGSEDQAALRCDYASEAVGEAAFALGLLDARGDVPIDSAEADRFARDYLRGVVTHEVGHTLGLRHNFHASTIHTEAQLEDAAYTRVNGLTGSVMDYTPFNIATRDEHQGEYVMSGLGPYDYWAIEYAYKSIDAATPDAERPELSTDRRPQRRADAGLRDRRGRRCGTRWHGPRGQPLRSRQRSAGLLPQALRVVARVVGSPAEPADAVGRKLRRHPSQRRARLQRDRSRRAADREVRRRRAHQSQSRGDAVGAFDRSGRVSVRRRAVSCRSTRPVRSRRWRCSRRSSSLTDSFRFDPGLRQPHRHRLPRPQRSQRRATRNRSICRAACSPSRPTRSTT